MSSSPLPLHAAPAAGFDEPFEMLAACHERVERMLGLLERLDAHLRDAGADASARQAARDVMHYFDVAGPAHHEDEERHVLPLLAACGDDALRTLASRLHADHRAMSDAWQAVRTDLRALAEGAWAGASASQQARWHDFARLYREHIVAEESAAYPAAAPRLDAGARAAMGADMARRRGARWPGT